MAGQIHLLEHRGEYYKPYVRMNGDSELYQSENGHVSHLSKGVLRCAYSLFTMDANGTPIKYLVECKKKPGARRSCQHTVTPDMEALVKLWRITRLTLCRLRMFEHIADFNKAIVKRVFMFFKAEICPDLVINFYILFKKQEASVKYLRRQTLRPWHTAMMWILN
jgi:hypothetical protein